jgi:ABC-type transporter Mla maintaining outer membrane lipid asymmetry ATPase subunit MlaF
MIAASPASVSATAPALLLEGVLPMADGEWNAPLDLTLAEGEWLVVRTTPARSEALLRICLGLAAARAGRVSVLGEDPGQLPNARLGPFRRRLGAALQPDGLVSNLPVLRNLVVPMVYSGVCAPPEAEQRATDALAQFGLESWRGSRPAELPEDVRAIVAVVRAVLRHPALCFLEDPFAAVKSVQAAGLLGQCRALAPTALVTTFRRNEPLYEAADRIALWDSRGFVPAEGA